MDPHLQLQVGEKDMNVTFFYYHQYEGDLKTWKHHITPATLPIIMVTDKWHKGPCKL